MTDRDKLLVLAKLYMLLNTAEGQLYLIKDTLSYTPKFILEKAIKSVANFIKIMEKVLTEQSVETAYDSTELISDVLDLVISTTENNRFEEFKESVQTWKTLMNVN